MGDDLTKGIIGSIFLHHRIYINGEQIFLDEKCIENIKEILNDLDLLTNLNIFKLSIVRKIFKDLIPDDSIFLMDRKEISKEDEKEIDIYDFIGKNEIINIFSPKLYTKVEYKKTFFNSNNYKVLETKNNFNIIQYPIQYQQIEQNDYYPIIIYGTQESNLSFLDGFLNFLFNINIDDSYRLLLERSNNDIKDFINIKYINSNKGNFKIIYVNIKKKINLDLEKIKEVENTLESFANENYIDLLVCNNTEIEICSIEKLKDNIFFCCPNNTFYGYKFNFLNIEMNFEEKVKDWMKNFKEIVLNIAELDEKMRSQFISCYLDFSSIFKDEKNFDNIFRYNITMKGYAYLYDSIIKRKNNYINLSSLKRYLSYLKQEMISIEEQIKLYEEKKEFYLKLKEKKEMENKNQLKEYSNEKNKLLENLKNCESQISIYETILSYEKNILQNKSFLIPLEKENSDKEYIYNSKTNVCNICKFNCHLNCNHLFQSFCIGKKCKNCPNKCSSSFHKFVDYKYPIYDYRNILDILKRYHPKVRNISIEKLIKIIKKEKFEIIKNCEILKEKIKSIEEKEKLIQEYNINNDEDFFEVIGMNKKINEEIEIFNHNDFRENFDREKLDLHTELLVYNLEKCYKEKDYTFIDRPNSGSGGYGRLC